MEAASIGHARRQHLVGQAEQELLAVGQMGLVDVDAAVGEDAPGHLDRPRPLGAPGQELAADGVTHVVGEQGQAIDPERGDEGGGHVGLQRHGVGAVGLGRQPVPDHVEEHDTPSRPEAVEHGGVVERRRGEAMEDEQRLVAFGADGRRVDGEDALAAERPVRPDGFPAVAGGDRHVPANFATTGPRVSQASDSIDQYEIPYSARRHSSSSAISSSVPTSASGTCSASAASMPKAGAIWPPAPGRRRSP